MIDRKNLVGRMNMQVILVILAVIWLYPLTMMFAVSTRGAGFANYLDVVTRQGFHLFFMNSLMVAAADLFITLLCVTLAAYAFSKLTFPLKNIIFLLFIAGLMIPGAAFIVPLFATIKSIGLINNPFGLVGPHVAFGIPFALLIIKAYFDEIPTEIMEAAVIDGCNKFRIYRSLILPLGRPAIATTAIYLFLGSWNDYLLPLIILHKENVMTVTLLPQRFIAFGGSNNFGKIYACLVLISIPVFIVYLFGQKYLEKGMTAGTIK